MPGKSRRGRGKYSIPSKKKKGKLNRPAVITQQTAVSQARELAPQPDKLASAASMPTPMAKPAAVRYPYIANELRMIGIVAGVMLVVLAVLALVLS